MRDLYWKKRTLCCWLIAITLMGFGLASSLPKHAVNDGTTGQGPETGWQSLERVDTNDHHLPVKTTRRSLNDVHPPVEVNDDTELAAAAISGSGAVDDPYILGGWSITGIGPQGIYIHGTTKHFIISDCWISGFVQGIFIDETVTGTVTVANNTCINCASTGIWVLDSPSSRVINNTCWDSNLVGIWIYGSDSSAVANNTCQENDYWGIWFLQSPGSTAINNTSQENGLDGIQIHSSPSSTIVNNTCQDNSGSGVYIVSSDINAIVNNTCQGNSGDGIYIDSSSSSTVVNNTCRENDEVGITLWYSDMTIVVNNTCQGNGDGIVFRSSTSAAVNNTCRNNDHAGISIVDTANANVTDNAFNGDGLIIQGDLATFLSLTVVNNRVNGQPLGFLTDQSGGAVTAAHGQLVLVNCTDVAVEGQNCSATTRGIALYSSTRCAVRNSTCRDNSGEGIYISDSLYTAINCTLLAYNGDGLYIRNTARTLITWNTFIANRGHGVCLHRTTSNTDLYNNYFFNNSVQGRDDGYDNFWYKRLSERGNSWSDHDPRTGAVYHVTGLAGSSDPYPILDYDGDGMEDWYEYLTGLDSTNAKDAFGDQDEDGLDNLKEYLIGSWANSSDTDSDGMPDYYEYQNGLNWTLDDAFGDQDGDGLFNIVEYHLGTYVNNNDTDSDGMPDFYEVITPGLVPWVDDAYEDLDNDTMTNIWEYMHGLNASNPADAHTDPDGDWVSNVDEFRGGSNPFDFWSVPLVSFSVLHLVLASFCTASVTGLYYRKRRRKALVTRFSAPDHTTAVQIKKAGLSDYAAFLQAGEEAKAVIQEGNACFHRGDLDGAIQQYERALETVERLGNDFLTAETVFRIAQIQKEQSKLVAWSPVLERFPGRSRDMRVEIFDHMVQALLAETGHNWGTAKKRWQAALDAGGINAEFQTICQGALVGFEVKNWLDNPITATREVLLSRLEEWQDNCKVNLLYSLSCRAYLLRARVTLASLQFEKVEESLNNCLTVAREHGLENYAVIARDELEIFSQQKERLMGLMETTGMLTREEQEQRLYAYIKTALKSLERDELGRT